MLDRAKAVSSRLWNESRNRLASAWTEDMCCRISEALFGLSSSSRSLKLSPLVERGTCPWAFAKALGGGVAEPRRRVLRVAERLILPSGLCPGCGCIGIMDSAFVSRLETDVLPLVWASVRKDSPLALRRNIRDGLRSGVEDDMGRKLCSPVDS